LTQHLVLPLLPVPVAVEFSEARNFSFLSRYRGFQAFRYVVARKSESKRQSRSSCGRDRWSEALRELESQP